MIGEFLTQPYLAALYHLSDVNDSSGNSNTLVNNGTVTFPAGRFGNCADFGSPNTTKFLSRASNLGLNMSNPLSVSFWIYPKALPASNGYMCPFILRTTTSGYLFVYLFNNAGTQQILFGCGSGNNADALTITYALPLNTWTYLEFTSSGSNTYAYINGKQVGTRGRVSAGSTAYNDFYMGRFTSSTYYLSGMIDEFVIFLRQRYDDEIRKWYAWTKGMLY